MRTSSGGYICGVRRAIVRVRFMFFMEAVLLVVVVMVVVTAIVLVPQIRPDEPPNMSSLSAVEVAHRPQSVRVNDDAPENICFMLDTLDTSQLEMSPLNDVAE